MPANCHHLTALHAHSYPCLVSLLFIPSLYSTFLNSKNFLFTLQSRAHSSWVRLPSNFALKSHDGRHWRLVRHRHQDLLVDHLKCEVQILHSQRRKPEFGGLFTTQRSRVALTTTATTATMTTMSTAATPH